MYTFLPPARCREFIYDWYAAAVRRGTRFAGAIGSDNFCHHVGLQPTGQWTLFPAQVKEEDGQKVVSKVVWIPMSIYNNYGRQEILDYIADHEHELPHQPWATPLTQGAEGTRYITRYFNAKSKLCTFASADELLAVVGPRPGPEWSLTTSVYPTRRRRHAHTDTKLSTANFLWVTEDAIKAAKQGKLIPPVFPPSANRTPEDQAINDARFRSYIEGVVKYAQDTQSNRAWVTEKEEQLRQLILKMEEFVVGKGYQPQDVLNPLVLPDHQKLQKGRQLAQALMDDIARGPGYERRREALRRLNEANRAKQQTARLLRDANHVPNPRGRGRPLKRFIKRKVKIADLTPAQKQQLGIPADQDFIRIRTENTGRWARRTWVEMEIRNPALPQPVSTEAETLDNSFRRSDVQTGGFA